MEMDTSVHITRGMMWEQEAAALGDQIRCPDYCTLPTTGSPDVTCDKVLGQIIVSSEVLSRCDM